MTKLKLKYTKIEYVEKEEIVDITFPLYRLSVYNLTSVYMKINEDRTAIRLEIRDVGFGKGLYDFQEDEMFSLTLINAFDFDDDIKFRSDVDFCMGRGEYALTEEEFYNALHSVAADILELMERLDK